MSTYPESHLDLLGAPGVGLLSTVTPGGDIQTTALWYLFEGGELKFSLSDQRRKFRNLEQNPTATFFLIDPANSFRFIEVRGKVTIEPDADFSFRAKVGAQYGADVASFDTPDTKRYVVTLQPSKVNAQ
jgi:PPOX class probable F420-dependent enzyme